jgi:hypothetical protein
LTHCIGCSRNWTLDASRSLSEEYHGTFQDVDLNPRILLAVIKYSGLRTFLIAHPYISKIKYHTPQYIYIYIYSFIHSRTSMEYHAPPTLEAIVYWDNALNIWRKAMGCGTWLWESCRPRWLDVAEGRGHVIHIQTE